MNPELLELGSADAEGEQFNNENKEGREKSKG